MLNFMVWTFHGQPGHLQHAVSPTPTVDLLLLVSFEELQAGFLLWTAFLASLTHGNVSLEQSVHSWQAVDPEPPVCAAHGSILQHADVRHALEH